MLYDWHADYCVQRMVQIIRLIATPIDAAELTHSGNTESAMNVSYVQRETNKKRNKKIKIEHLKWDLIPCNLTCQGLVQDIDI